jgi:hypothetical protein
MDYLDRNGSIHAREQAQEHHESPGGRTLWDDPSPVGHENLVRATGSGIWASTADHDRAVGKLGGGNCYAPSPA